MTAEATPAIGVGRTLWTHAPRVLASLVIAGGFVWLIHRGGLPLIPPRSAFAELRPWAIPGYLALTALGVFFRSYRWVYLLRPIAPDVSGRRVIGVGLVGFAAVLFAPLRMGEAVRPYLLARDGKISFMQGIGAVGAERIADGLTLTFAAAVALALSTPISPLPNHLGGMPLPVSAVPKAIYAAFLLFVLAFAAMALFYRARELARRVTLSVLGVVSLRFAKFATATLERLADGLKFLPSRKNFFSFFRDTLLYWTCGILAQWLLMRGCGIPASLTQACVTLGVLGLGVLVPAGPGFFGAYQIATYTGLALFFGESVVVSSGAALVFLSYAGQLLLTALGCGLGLWILARKEPATQPSP